MDQTNLFRAHTKTIALRNTSNESFASKPGTIKQTAPSSALKEHHKFSKQGKEILIVISRMRDCILKYRQDDVKTRFLLAETSSMTALERDKIDNEIHQLIKSSNLLIENLRADARVTPQSQRQLLQHRLAIIDIIETYLKTICKLFAEHKAICVKRTFDFKKMSRLETLVRNSKLSDDAKFINNDSSSGDLAKQNDISASSDNLNRVQDQSAGLRRRKVLENDDKTDQPVMKRSVVESSKKNIADSDSSSVVEPSTLSQAEEQQLQKENDELYKSMTNMVDEIQQIEGKVVEIARLQEIFMEKVLEQDTTIGRVHDTTVNSTEDIRMGNEQIRQAMKSKAGMRVWILFFLTVMSFTLLFLDWYNA